MAHLNVALIGYAFMGRAHSNAYRQVGRFFSPKHLPRMKVLCGRTPAGVKAAAEQLGWEEAATDWREVVRRKDIDIVDIATPGDSHAEIAIAAAKAGKVVFCEKPLANTIKEAEKMLAAVKKAGVLHMICHNYRRAPAVMLARQLIDQGKLGRLYHFRGTYLQDWVADPSVPLYWRLRKEAAGTGALGDIASHSLDLARFLVGEVTEVTGALETFVKERPLPENPKKKGKVTVDDASASVVRFANGALGTIEASRFATGRKNYNRFEINGSTGSVAFNLERMNELDVYLTADDRAVQGFHNVMVTDGAAHPYFSHWWPDGHIIGYEHTFIHTVHDLLEAIATDTMPTPNFEDGVRNQKVLDAMEKAAVTRKWVTV
ncbi:MAG TPA: Gfo/Idh/MocA family oxidoreductase [Thiobacillaceae bacterium]